MPERHKFLVRPLFLQVRDELASRIASNHWRAGECIPNEINLATEYGVSQGTMRKALDVMEAEKLVVRRQGRGTFVIDANSTEIATRFSSIFLPSDLKVEGAISEIRAEVVEPDTEAIENLRVTPGDLLRRSERVHSHKDIPFMIETSTIVRRHWPQANDSELRYARITDLAQKFGIALSHAVEQVVACACPEHAAESLHAIVGDPILKINRVIFSDRGDRIEWRSGWCNTQQIKFMSVTS